MAHGPVNVPGNVTHGDALAVLAALGLAVDGENYLCQKVEEEENNG